MTITKDHIGGLVFLCFSIVYGYYGSGIEMFPGDEYQPFNAKIFATDSGRAWHCAGVMPTGNG